VTRELLDPTLDVVFKLLLTRNPELLRDMIESVLGCEPITEVTVLNPEIPREFPADKSIVLDIRVRLRKGHQIDLEMQSTTPPGIRARFLYYWAKAFSELLAKGEDYTLLRPCISVLWFKEPLLKGRRFHSIFHLSEDESREKFSSEIEFHVLELPKLGLAPVEHQAKLERWARFLRAETPEELEQLAREDSTMTTARNALEELSMDPDAQRLARERETAVLVHRHLIAASREEGRTEGREEGLRGGTLIAIRGMCSILGVDIDIEKTKYLESLSLEQLAAFVEKLQTERRWPDVF
jgi:predicted transposase/invertase (TIGR01784 family)